jgi:hypothetical protein
MKRRAFVKSGCVSLIATSLDLSGLNESLLWASTPGADFHVAPDGKDENSGTADAPFATLGRARDAVRKRIRAGLTKDTVVLIRGGVYAQTETLIFGPEDSGTEKYSITYAAVTGEKVVLTGGREITNWKKGSDDLWTADVSEVKAGRWYFRQLFVDGVRAHRTRTPKPDDKNPWWKIETSTARGGTYEDRKNRAPESEPVVLSVTGPIAPYQNPEDVELVYVYNNDGGRKRLKSINTDAKTLTLALPNRWNPVQFEYDCMLSVPTAGKACYLENALELMSRPGEWYLDRKTGVVTYWPRPGEDMTRVHVIAPVVQNSLLTVRGTAETPVRNLHFQGLRIEHVDWPLPAEGYMGLFCCNVAVFREPNPGHRFIDAAVEFSYAKACSYRDGAIAHVGAMGVCLRDGTSDISIEGNEIHDLGGGGIGAGGCNVAAGYLDAAPSPQPGEFSLYRLVNNYVHHCGTDYYGAAGIVIALAQEALIAHNLIHDTAYFGIALAGSQDPRAPFAGNHKIEFNHIHDAMQVTVDGAGLYITFAQCGRGTLVRGNLIHDTAHGRADKKWGDHPPSAGIYLDGFCSGGRFEQNVLYRNLAAGPLILNFAAAQTTNSWLDNIFQKEGTPPQEFLDAMQGFVGLQPAYRKSILGAESGPCFRYSAISDSTGEGGFSVYQFDMPSTGRGAIEIIAGSEADDVTVPVALRGLDAKSRYELKAYAGTLKSDTIWGPGTMPILSNIASIPLPRVGLEIADGRTVTEMDGRSLAQGGLMLKLQKAGQVLWVAYQRTNQGTAGTGLS